MQQILQSKFLDIFLTLSPTQSFALRKSRYSKLFCSALL
jgi:hypothetical protein